MKVVDSKRMTPAIRRDADESESENGHAAALASALCRTRPARQEFELCEQFGYSRKHAIKLLNAQSGWGGEPGGRRGRPPKYEAATVEVLQRIWRAAEQPCGKRLKALLKTWLPHYEDEHGKLDAV